MKQYLEFIQRIMQEGKDRPDRTGVGVRSLFHHEMIFDLSQGFPLVTTKRVHFKSIALELLWFLRGDSNVRWLQERGVSIWDEWADAQGDLGPVYGYQWRHWPDGQGSIDQIALLIEQLQSNPYSRRHIVSAWNVAMLPQMALPPCHMMFQCYSQDGVLSLKIIQRSADAFLGVPFNIASYALLCHILAHLTHHRPGHLIWSGGDCHLYHNHFDAVNEQLKRTPCELPSLQIAQHVRSLEDLDFSSFELIGYHPHPSIRAPIAV